MDRAAGASSGVVPGLHGCVLGADADLAFRSAARACAPQGQARRSCPHRPLRRSNQKEADMLLHLPIAIMVTLSPIPVSNTVPTFDLVRECRLEARSMVDFDRCSRDEAIALRQLQQAWTEFAAAD